ncbi:DUF742 domain-containing protein [Streptomyces sp. NPDC048641]|uniref:DUF742 domain-containing protein n=1 Tax=unclassified Streptomyces TaxID=2593676 RepID=UPI0034388395
MSGNTPQWYDDEAGPMVRLYAMTKGRAQPAGEMFDLMAVVHAVPEQPRQAPVLSPEQRALAQLCGTRPRPVADLASESGLPLGVVRVLLSDLLAAGLIRVTAPVPPARLPEPDLLRRVIDGLHAL